MNKIHIEPTQINQKQHTTLFNQGWSHLINQQWQLAEDIFTQIEAQNAHYEQDGLHVSKLRQKAKFEREAETAWQLGDLKAALAAYKKADDFERAEKVYELLTIHELETKAERLTATSNFKEAAWIYDQLLNDFPNREKESNWQFQKGICWKKDLMPNFNRGLSALGKKRWRKAYKAFTQVLLSDPYFQQDGRSAAACAEKARKEVVIWADLQLRQGQVSQALAAYREVGHLGRLENVDEFLHLRRHEEAKAVRLETEGKWQAAAAKYNYLSTLYYDENGRIQWQTASDRCLEEGRLSTLHKQGMTAFNNKQWAKAEKLFGKIVTLHPNYQQGKQTAHKLHRIARWRKFISHLIPLSDSSPMPTIQTGKLS
ncbi:MAG: tetratricopeptide repeat protein [Chloroflexi bacterium]|nr:tetratricopeptide repeat protein [Chloroflexota bacterium]